MSRLSALDRATLTSEQRRVYDHIEQAHGRVRGPWAVVLRVPEVAEHLHALYERLCVNTQLGKRRFELMVILVARHWTAQFEWFAHARLAREAGLPDAVIEAIRERRVPPLECDDDRLIYDIVTEMNDTRTLSDASYERALAALGETLLVELICAMGTYTSIAIQLNAFNIPIPADAIPLT